MSEHNEANHEKRKERQRSSRNSKLRDKREIHKERKVFFSILSLLAVVVLLVVLQKQSSCYEIFVGSQAVAQVEDKKEAGKIWDELLADQAKKTGQEVVPSGEIEFKKTPKKDAILLDGQELKQALERQVEFLTTGYTVKVNGEPLFSLKSRQAVEEILEEYKREFQPEIEEGVEIIAIGFKEQVEITEELVRIDGLTQEDKAREELRALEILDTIYEIKKGDNFWDIARAHEMGVSELMQLNPDAVPEKLMPGQEILIKAGQPRVTVSVELKTTVVEDIPPPTRYIDDSSLLSNDRRIVEPGVPGEKEVVYQITLENGHEANTEVLQETILKEPTERVVKKGTRTFLARGVGRNYGIVSARRVTSNYGYRTHPIYKTRRFHEGIDLAAPRGRSVHAYSAGTVTFAGRTGALGLAVYINHGNGLETRYGHLSKIHVKKGEKVATGAKIGAVGSTGLSTGPHLHFEVRKNGKHQNPWDYI